MLRFLCTVVLVAATMAAQGADGFLSAARSTQLLERCLQLMEATTAATPGLTEAAAPILEDARQSMVAIRANNRIMPSRLLTYLRQVRAYQALSAALITSTQLPEEGRKQLIELHNNVEILEAHFRALLERTEAQLRPPDRDNLRRYAQANATLPPPDPAQQRVLFYGDSITDGWHLEEYFIGKAYVNRGISGQITGEMLGRMMADVLNNKPAAMILLAGTNDLARNVPIDAIENNIAMISALAAQRGIKVVLSSILPVSDYHKAKNPRNEMTLLRQPAKILQINTWMEEYAKQNGFIFCNYFTSLVDGSGFLQAELADDGLHPNASGYKVMAPLAQACIDQALSPKLEKPVQQNTRKRRLPF